jgi:hypothetical protein
VWLDYGILDEWTEKTRENWLTSAMWQRKKMERAKN